MNTTRPTTDPISATSDDRRNFFVSSPCVRLRMVAMIAPAGIAAANNPLVPADSNSTCNA